MFSFGRLIAVGPLVSRRFPSSFVHHFLIVLLMPPPNH